MVKYFLAGYVHSLCICTLLQCILAANAEFPRQRVFSSEKEWWWGENSNERMKIWRKVLLLLLIVASQVVTVLQFQFHIFGH